MEKSGFQKNFEKKLTSKIFGPSHSRVRVAKGKPAFRGVSRGKCGLRKTEKIFSANNEQGTRIFTLGLHYSCIPSYNNIVKIFSTSQL